jgi:hypothetical protein
VSSLGVLSETNDVLGHGVGVGAAAGFTINWNDTNGEINLGVPPGIAPGSASASATHTAFAPGSYTIQVKTLDVATQNTYISAAFNVNTPMTTQAGIAANLTSAKGTVFNSDGMSQFTGTITLLPCVIADGTLAGKPASEAAIKCSYDPPQFLLDGSTVKVTISTNNAPGAGVQSHPIASLWLGLTGVVFAGFGGAWMTRRQYSKRRLVLQMIAILGIMALALSVACGGGFHNPIKGSGLTPSGPYTIVINGQDSTGQIRTVTAVKLVVTAD